MDAVFWTIALGGAALTWPPRPSSSVVSAPPGPHVSLIPRFGDPPSFNRGRHSGGLAERCERSLVFQRLSGHFLRGDSRSFYLFVYGGASDARHRRVGSHAGALGQCYDSVSWPFSDFVHSTSIRSDSIARSSTSPTICGRRSDRDHGPAVEPSLRASLESLSPPHRPSTIGTSRRGRYPLRRR